MSNHEWTKTILTAMHSLLKPVGFRKKGATWHLERDDVVLLVQLQKSWYSTGSRVSATVNLGVFSWVVHRKVGYSWDKPGISSAHWRQRIGFLMPERDDKWWEVTSDAEAVGAAREIVEALAAYGLPALESLSSTGKLRDLWTTGYAGLTDRQREEYLEALATTGG